MPLHTTPPSPRTIWSGRALPPSPHFRASDYHCGSESPSGQLHSSRRLHKTFFFLSSRRCLLRARSPTTKCLCRFNWPLYRRRASICMWVKSQAIILFITRTIRKILIVILHLSNCQTCLTITNTTSLLFRLSTCLNCATT